MKARGVARLDLREVADIHDLRGARSADRGRVDRNVGAVRLAAGQHDLPAADQQVVERAAVLRQCRIRSDIGG
jgi:hypothetical protein